MPHTPQLDGIRALAIAMVFLAHAGLEWIVPGGFGVTVFFFLSGYLITTLMRFEQAANGRISLKDFYLRRILRIFPPLYITLLVAGALCWAGLLPDPVDRSGVLSQMLLVTNYGDWFGPNHGLPLPLWSLAVEEHFYFVFPLCFMVWFGAMRPARAAAICLAVCGAILAIRIGNVLASPDFMHNYTWTHTRLDSILFGCCLALWNNPLIDANAYRPKLAHVAAALAVLLVCFAIRDEHFRQSLRYTLQGGALWVLFSYALQDNLASRALSSAIAARIALYSYTMYLMHTVAFAVLEGAFPQMGTAPRFLIALVVTLVYADLMYRFVERPAGALRRRLHQRRSAERERLKLQPAP